MEAEVRQRGGAESPLPPARGSGECCELSRRGLERSPDCPKSFPLFSALGKWPLLTLDFHAAIGGKTPWPPCVRP